MEQPTSMVLARSLSPSTKNLNCLPFSVTKMFSEALGPDAHNFLRGLRVSDSVNGGEFLTGEKALKSASGICSSSITRCELKIRVPGDFKTSRRFFNMAGFGGEEEKKEGGCGLFVISS